MKKLIIVIFALIILFGMGLLVLSNRTNIESKAITRGRVYKMVLGENGYAPADINIKKEDVIEFSTSLDKPFWPASEIHPTHGIYPEFDPRDAVAPGQTWSFKFEKTGTWRYHDHLAPYFTGRITVE